MSRSDGQWCVVVYRFVGGAEVHGPYELRALAATAAVMLERRDEIDAAYVIQMEPPS